MLEVLGQLCVWVEVWKKYLFSCLHFERISDFYLERCFVITYPSQKPEAPSPKYYTNILQYNITLLIPTVILAYHSITVHIR